ncbi:MAG: hypothetical protein ACKVOI_20405 [Dongiaceae bacterium]
MGDFFNIALNGAISVLLVITIVYAVILNRKLRQLQSNQSELAAILGRLDGALLTASVTVSALRESTDAPEAAEAPVQAPAPARFVPQPQQGTARPVEAARPVAQQQAKPVPQEAAPKPAARKPKAMLRADTLAERLEMAQVRPADGQPLMVRASAPRPAQQEPGRHRAAADELMSVMRNLRKG